MQQFVICLGFEASAQGYVSYVMYVCEGSPSDKSSHVIWMFQQLMAWRGAEKAATP